MEIYKDIAGYENRYKVSTYGNVYSTPNDGKPSKLLKQEVIKNNHTNYRRVSLSKEGKVKRFAVHRLVAQTFIPNPEDKPQVNHIDNNGENNKVKNLEWATPSENMTHSYVQGRLDANLNKGRKESANRMYELAEARYKEIIGTSYNYWKVIGHIYEEGTHKCQVTCTKCNNEEVFTRQLFELENESSRMCKSCSMKTMWESKELPQLDQNKYSIPIVEDLGMLSINGKRKERWAIFYCPVCNKNFKARVGDIARSKAPENVCKHKKRNII